MKQIIKQLEKQLEKLEEIIEKREDKVSEMSDKWQESEKCEEWEYTTEDIGLCVDDLHSVIDGLNNL